MTMIFCFDLCCLYVLGGRHVSSDVELRSIYVCLKSSNLPITTASSSTSSYNNKQQLALHHIFQPLSIQTSMTSKCIPRLSSLPPSLPSPLQLQHQLLSATA